MSLFDSISAIALKKGLTWLGRRSLPRITGKLALAGLTAPVEIIRDRWGVPHIYADSIPDLFFAQGFVHAQERLWQMELNRRTAAGRLSEIFGLIALDTDRATRTFGFQRLAEADWITADNVTRDLLSAYSAGVNAFLQIPSSRLPVEFTLLRHRPEPWHPQDSLAFLRLMSWQMSHAWYSEIVRAQMIEAVGQERAAEWDIYYPADNPVTLPQGIEFYQLAADGSFQVTHSPFLERGKGSNAWVISGAKSPTGQPYLCNDAHLGLKTPSVWYQNHLVADGINVTGVSLPASPLVIIGHNAQIAWGLTLAFTDCEDLFIERFDPQQPHRYQFRDDWHEADVVSETIQVKGQTDTHIEKVILTHHGPIISEAIGLTSQRLALQSMALRSPVTLKGWWLLNRAAGWDDFAEAMRLIEAPQLNIVYADVGGNIGYWLTGAVPIRAKGQGEVPLPGWTDEYEWTGTVPFEEMPHALNPQQGYILSCNHRVVTDDYPYFLGNVWMNGYRARRISDLFKAKDILTVEDFRAIQLDVACRPSLEFVECLADLPEPHPDSEVQLALSWLRGWDGQLTVDSVAGAIYQVTRYTLVLNLLEPALGQPLTKRLLGEGFNPVLLSSHELYGYDTVSLLRILKNPASWWLNQAGGRQAVLTRSLKQAVVWLRRELGAQAETWQWGHLHRVSFVHPLGVRKPLDQVFNLGPFPIGGDTDTPCQTAMLPNAPYDTKGWGPSIRQIIDMSDLSRSLISVPPGQSGHIASPHYADQLQPWLRGNYHPMLWTRAQVEAASEGELHLIPHNQ